MTSLSGPLRQDPDQKMTPAIVANTDVQDERPELAKVEPVKESEMKKVESLNEPEELA